MHRKYIPAVGTLGGVASPPRRALRRRPSADRARPGQLTTPGLKRRTHMAGEHALWVILNAAASASSPQRKAKDSQRNSARRMSVEGFFEFALRCVQHSDLRSALGLDGHFVGIFTGELLERNHAGAYRLRELKPSHRTSLINAKSPWEREKFFICPRIDPHHSNNH